MAEAENGAGLSEEASAEADRSLLRQLRSNWQLFCFAAGAFVLVFGLVVWQGPLALLHRQAALEQLREAERLWKEGDFLAADKALRSLEPSLWRIEEHAGDAYFLMGVVSNDLAEASAGAQGAAYRSAAMPYLREAARRGVSSRYLLPLYGETGRGLLNARDYAGAVPSLEEAIGIRRELQRVIYRRLLQAVATLEPIEKSRLSELLAAWSGVRGLPGGEKELVESLQADLQAGELAAFRESIDDPGDEVVVEPLNPIVFQVDARAEIQLQLGHAAEAIEELEEERKSNNTAIADLLSRMIAARIQFDPPDYRGALANGDEWIGLPGLARHEVDAALQMQAQLLMGIDEPLEARAYLEKMNDGAGPKGGAKYLLARTYFAEGRKWEFSTVEQWQEKNPAVEAYGQLVDKLDSDSAKGSSDRLRGFRRWLAVALRPSGLKQTFASLQYEMAVKNYGEVLADLELRDDKYFGLALLEMGQALTSMENYVAADQAYERAINAFPGSDFERAAQFYRADAYRRSGDERTIESFREAAEASLARNRNSFRNSYMTAEDLRGIFTSAWRVYQSARRYEDAVAIAELYAPFATGGIAYQMRADSAKENADELIRRAAGELYLDAQATRAEARDFHDRAGEDYLRAARAEQASEQYQDLLWQAALSSYEGHAYDRCHRILDELLREHGGGERDSAILLLLARCQMSQGAFPQARETLEGFLSRLPRSPNRFEARIDLAECYLELADEIGPAAADTEPGKVRSDYFAKAQELLAENIDGLDFDLEPTALAWQRSVFVLGRLLHEKGSYEAAIARLLEAVQRYPDVPQVVDALYRVADSYREWAREPEIQLRSEETPRGRMLLEQDKNRRLRLALAEYEVLADRLAKAQESRPLTPDEQILLRSSFFAIGDVYAALEDWPQAIEAFTTAANRFQDRPDCLSAYVQIANAYLRQGKASEAGSTLRQARWVLNQLDETLFAESALTKEQWKNRLDSLVGDL